MENNFFMSSRIVAKALPVKTTTSKLNMHYLTFTSRNEIIPLKGAI